AVRDLQRDEALLRKGYATAQSVDQRRADQRSAEAKVQAAEAALAQAKAPMGREREIEAQRAAAAAAQAAVAMAEWRLAQRTVAAPVGGRVADVLAQPGDDGSGRTRRLDTGAGKYLYALFCSGDRALGTAPRRPGRLRLR